MRDASFESPRAPDVFTKEWRTKVQVDINARNKRLDDQRYEVMLTLTLEAKVNDEAAMIVGRIAASGHLSVAGLEDALRDQVLATTCPATLFPYLRETLDSLVVKGSFPPILLAPSTSTRSMWRRWEEENQSHPLNRLITQS